MNDALRRIPEFLSGVLPRLHAWWNDARSTLWLLPTLAVLFAVVLANVIVWLDQRMSWENTDTTSRWLYGAGAEGARGVLSAIASSTITVVGTVFSVTIVGLQLATSQFTPTVMRQFTGNPVNKSVLAVYLGTFTYALLVLRSVRGGTDDSPAFVPVIGVTLGIVLAVVCVVMLIVFIHQIAKQMQVANILAWAAATTLEEVDRTFPERADGAPAVTNTRPHPGQRTDVRAHRAGYLQYLEIDALTDFVREHEATVRLLPPMGSWVNEGEMLAYVWSDDRSRQHAAAAVNAALVFGSERTTDGDVAHGLRQIADIAIRALSSSYNDATTATKALDRIGQILCRVGARATPARIVDIDGRPALYLTVLGFEELLAIGVSQVRVVARDDLVVLLHLVDMLARVGALVDTSHRPALLRHLDLVREAGASGLDLASARMTLDAAIDEATARVRDHDLPGEHGNMVPDWSMRCSG